MSKDPFRSFLTGTFVGLGMGLLFLAKEDCPQKENLKESFQTLRDTIQDIDVEETKKEFQRKVAEIKKELSTIQEDTAREYAKEKMSFLQEKCDELILVAQKEEAFGVEKALQKVKEEITNLIQEFLEELGTKEEKKIEPKVTKKVVKKVVLSKNKKPKKKH